MQRLTVEEYRAHHAATAARARIPVEQLLRMVDAWPSWVRAVRDQRPHRIARSDGDRAAAAR